MKCNMCGINDAGYISSGICSPCRQNLGSKTVPDINVTSKEQSISDEIREAFKPFENLERSYIDHCDKYGPVVDLHPEGNRLYYYDVEAALYHSKENIKSIQKKAHVEIEELTKSLGTYYDLNMKLEQQIEQWNNDYAKLKTYASSLEDTIENMKYEDEFH